MVSLSALSSTFNKESYMKKTIIAALMLVATAVSAQEAPAFDFFDLSTWKYVKCTSVGKPTSSFRMTTCKQGT